MPTVRRVDATWAREIAALLEVRGKSAKLILKEVDLDPKKVQEPDARIPFAKHVALLDAAAEHLGDPCFGLDFGSGIDPLDTGLIGYVATSSAKLGEAIHNFVTYIRVHSEGVRPRLEIEGQVAIISAEVIDPSVRQRQQIYEYGLALAMNVARFVTGRRLVPEWVEFRHHRRDDIVEFRRYFGAPVHFGMRRNAIILKRSHLDLTCRSADARLLRILKGYCEEILKQRPEKGDLKRDVEHLIVTHLPSGAATKHRVARELGMSVRTLARRLSDVGTSFGQILEEVRRQLAVR